MTAIRTSKQDRNWLSLNSDSVVWFAGTPEEKQGDIPYPITLLPEAPQVWDAVLKLSNRTNTSLMGVKVAQGQENSVDMNNRTSGIVLEGRFGVGGGEGDNVFTIKGGSYDITVKGTIESTGRVAELTIGNWSDQSTEPSHHLDLSLLRCAGDEPVTVVFGRVTNPLRTILFNKSPDISLPRNSKVKIWKSLGLLSYWWLKRLYVLLRYRRW